MGNALELAALSRLLDIALALPASERERWLDALQGSDRALQPVLRRLLAEHQQPQRGDFLRALPRLPLVTGDTQHDALHDGACAAPLQAGDEVGPYRLLRELGRGGMGTVWLAERADGAYSRRVALKVPRLERDPRLAQRLVFERDIAAPLEHPHIARLYDAGVDAQGRPYLALQYIEGVPIDRFCRERQLSLRSRLELFVQVVRAVAYAHGCLVVHRDIKPSNILVSQGGEAHLLDFGIAGWLRDAAAPASCPSGLTPGYAAPEQRAGAPSTVTSDVYSLGVLLHELLTGALPSRELPIAPAPALRGDLQAIVSKALRTDPAERYASAEAFADDVVRYLSCEPVRAQPPSLLYRARKAWQRHRLAYAAVGVAAIAMIAGAAVAWTEARRATEAADRARVVKDFVVDVFRVNARDNPAKAELRQLPAELLLERGARLIDTRFKDQPELRAELDGVVSGIFADMSSADLAADYAGRQIALLDALRAEPAQRAAALLLQARALADGDRLTQAQASARRALSLADGDALTEVRARLLLVETLLRGARDADVQAELARTQTTLAAHPELPRELRAEAMRLAANRLNYLHNSFEAAMPSYLQAIREAVAAEGPNSPHAAAIRGDLVFSLVNLHRAAEARPHLEAALAALRAAGGADDIPAALLEAMSVKWMYVTGQLPYADARAALDRDAAALRAHGPSLPEAVTARLDFHVGAVEAEWGHPAAARALLSHALERLRSRVQTTWTLYGLVSTTASAAMDAGHHEEAGRLFDEAQKLGAGVVPASSPWLADTYASAALNLAMQGRFVEAEARLAAVPQIEPATGERDAPLRYRDMVAVARARVALDRGDARTALLRLPGDTAPIADDALLDRRLVRGAALCALGHTRDGLPLMAAFIAKAEAGHAPEHPLLAYWRARAGLCAWQAGQRAEAAAFERQAAAALTAQQEVSGYFKAPWLRLRKLVAASPEHVMRIARAPRP